MTKTISGKVFDARGEIPDSLWPSLFSRGDEVEDTLGNLGWKKEETVVAPVVMTDPASGNILGSRIVVKGPLSNVKVKATSIWPKARKDVFVSWNLRGENFTFSNRNTHLPSNVSDWHDGQASSLITLERDEQEISWSDINDGEEHLGLCFR